MNAKRRIAPWMVPLLLAPALVTCGGNERAVGPSFGFEQFGTSTQLVFINQPVNVGVLAPMPTIHVGIADAQGLIVTTSTATVTISITPGTGTPGAVLAKKLVRNAVNGDVGFEVLTIDRAGTGYTLRVTSPGLATATSAPFNVGATAGPAAKLGVLAQPTNVAAGATITPALRIAIQDAAGNTVTSSNANVTIAITGGTGTAGAVLGGTLTQAAVAGVASFANVTVDKSGNGYTLTSTSTGLTSVVTSAFNVTAGAAAALVVTTQPSSTTAGAAISPAVQVTVRDAFGNTVTGSSANVTLALTNGTGTAGAALGGTLTQAAVAGVATFANLSVDKTGNGYTLTATSSALANAVTTAFNISAGAASKLAYSVQPGPVGAGAPIAPAVQVTVQDAQGNTVTGSSASITLAITAGTGTAGAVLGGTLTQAASNGVATFSGLTLDKAGTGYTLAATSTGLTGATSAAFDVGVGAATSLAFTTQPSNVAAGSAIAPAVRVTIKDAQGNVVTSSSAGVTIAITGGTGTAGAALGGTLTQNAVNGVATFGNLTVDKTGSGYTLTATSTGLSNDVSAAFNVSAGTAAKVVFSAQPSNVTSGAAISPAVQVTVQDAQGNVVTSSSASITVAIGAGTGTAGATLGGTLTQAASGGVATFNNLSIDKAGTGYALTAGSSGLTGATSTTFNVAAGAAAKLAVAVQPSSAAVGAVITPAVQIVVQDAQGNVVTTPTSVTLATTGGTGTAGAVLGGTLSQGTIGGTATFNNLTVDLAGSSYTLSASAAGLIGATTSAFAISAAAGNTLVATSGPTTAQAGKRIPPFFFTVKDGQGNTVTSFNGTVTLAITSGTGTPGAIVSGVLVHSAVNGVVFFEGLTIDKVGTGYTMTATSPGVGNGVSAPFNITPNVATKLVYTVQPSTVVAGAIIAPAVKVSVQDAFGNVVTSSSAAITLAITAGSGTAGAVLGGTLTVNAVGGIATFSNLSINLAGNNFTLRATSGSLTTATSTAFNVTSAVAATKVAFTVQPSNATTGATISPAVQVAVQDVNGNVVPGSTAPVTLAITSGTGTAGAVLGGTLTVNAVNGVATFANLSVNLAGTGYTLTATSPSLTSAVSSAFNVSAPAATKLAVTVQPSNVITGASITPAVQVTVQDVNGSVVAGSTAPVTLAITAGTGTAGAVLGGTLTMNAVNGVATFANLSVNLVGTGYTLTATSPSLTNAVSSAFNVSAPPATKLAVTVQPSNVVVGASITPAVQVTVQDVNGNVVAGSTAPVTLAITSGTGTAGAVLGGTLTVNAVNGVATFANLSVNLAGTGYTLTATSPSLTNAVSTAFTVSALPATKLAYTVQPSNVVAGASIAPSIQVAVQNVNGQVVTTSTAPVTLAITSGTGTAGAVLGGTLTQNAVNGVATFNNITVNLAGTGYTLTATSAGLTNAVSTAFTVSAASNLTIQKFLGDNQTALVSFPTNIRPAVRILNGAVPVPNVAVTFAVTGGGGSVTGNTVVNTNANGVAQVGAWVVGAGAGSNNLTATGAGTYSGSNNVVFAANAQTAQYHVEIRNVGPAFSAPVQAAFNAAAAHWESVIYGDQSDVPINTNNACGIGVTINQTVDDIIILARFDSIDGPGAVLGSAGACSIRTSNGLSIYGVMQFDTADVAGLISSGSLNAVILHEMGHVLGFSSGIFNTQAGITQQRTCAQLLTSGNPPNVTHPDTHFNCTQGGALNFARAAFDSIGGTTYSGGLKVPLENCTGVPASCGGGTYNSHWRESTFGNELMTGYLNGGSNPFSLLTIAAFADEGYLVNYGAAQAYSHAFPTAGITSNVRVNLGNDHFNVAVDVVDDRSGTIMRVIPKQP